MISELPVDIARDVTEFVGADSCGGVAGQVVCNSTGVLGDQVSGSSKFIN